MKHKPYWITVIVVAVLLVILNLLTLSSQVCDFYVDNIFKLWVNTYGRFSGMFSFSLGERLIVVGILLVLAALVSALLLIFLRKKAGYRKYAKKFFKIFLVIIEIVVLIMTLNCTFLYGCSKLKVSENSDAEYTVDDLENLRNMIVENCNRLAQMMPRDENGYVVYDIMSVSDSISLRDARTDGSSLAVTSYNMYAQAVAAMHGISDEFPRLTGYYPKAKPISGSQFMSQNYTLGVYFPFSMEANYNNVMYIMNYPSAICHEYCHLKGYIFEDEANFLAYLACINSDDIFFQYSGYLSVLWYVNNSYYDSVDSERYNSQVKIRDDVRADTSFLTPEVWEEVEEASSFDTDKVNEKSNEFVDGYLKYFGVDDGIASYDRVTELLLEYYEEML
jgi:hypothetical protein